MSTAQEILAKYYYLNDDFDVRTLQTPELKDIFNHHGIPYGPNMNRYELIRLFRQQIFRQRDLILNDLIDSHQKRASSTNPSYSAKASHPNTDPDDLFDADGFRIPAVPLRKKSGSFNPEDSFASSEDELPCVPSQATPSGPSLLDRIPASNIMGWLHKRLSPEPESDLFSDENGRLVSRIKSRSEASEFPSEVNKASSPEPEQGSLFCTVSDSDRHETGPSFGFVQEDDESDDPDYNPEEEGQDEASDEEEEDGEEDEGDDEWEEEDDEYDYDDSDYSPDIESEEDADEEEWVKEKVEDVELYYLHTDASTPLRRVRNLYKQKQARPTNAESFKVLSLAFIKRNFAFSCSDLYRYLSTLRRFFILLVLFVSFFMSIIALCRLKNGYCSNIAQETKHTDCLSSDSVLPLLCIPCPSKGICLNGNLICEGMYVRKRRIYNPGGILPISDECRYSTETSSQIRGLEHMMKKILSEQQGKLVYQEFKANPRHKSILPQKLASTPLHDFTKYLEATIAEGLSASEANEVFSAVLSKIYDDPAIYVWRNTKGLQVIGTTLTTLPLRYYLLKVYRFFCLRYTWYLTMMACITMISFAGVKYFLNNRAYKKKVEQLARDAIKVLAQQYQNHVRDPAHYPSSAVPIDVVKASIIENHDEQSLKDWSQVVYRVNLNPGIRTSIHEHLGEPVECWEMVSKSYFISKE
ncbi:hypothetical protein G6F57_010592 [Rhizopus arrhizus]|uniref:Man1/Src1-like C-terminal domain-containing protein n=1 Tax=Rhizopus oryzae TaxID=64495 RepID=A0A9P7BRA6_RHIOR|nr:hypothetical protein G6F23_006843 [Rhizopus arrhizus]KAG1412636.1 hypothetical protein G6F58_007912 [Rhizopus delemar]KAG0757397.1 hypothetical protein G6F24_010508 [Rhizopus arrhizus]KAG0789980.1 hypothetical protein G6F21_006131 [Rhizopus arrhizus]KAG0801613.1 hypothetical protein G6F22_001073 [Rhizopus arrhizus]